ncbi:MAG TPA: molybdopterin-dependent oxidoreductase [Xanthobacteraceae bacterium]|nr:molybdopterin-dependent oxidoreductase [Xanthobacteraceae bacterium]
MNAPVAPPAVPPPAVHTTCPYCGVGCGVLATPDGAGGAGIAGDPDHPANFGRLCSKGSALGETLALGTRLLHPMARGNDGALYRLGWDVALDRVAGAFRDAVARHGPGSVALYLSGQLLTEDYYAANKLAKGFLGTANVDTNSRLCMASSVAGHRRAFGADTVPGTYEDLDQADLIVLVGSNAAWCHPVLFRRIEAARAARGTKIVVIDPRRTATGDEADLFLPVRPGTDTLLFSGLLAHLSERGAIDQAYVAAHTTGFATALEAARAQAPDLPSLAASTGLPVADIERFFAVFTATERVVTAFSQGVNQSAQGTDKVNAIINLHLATGRIGRPGMGPFSLTGQPNAMGGREVGGLANQLAAHMGFAPDEVDRVRRFWDAPHMAEREGLKAVALFEAAARGEIKALWVMGTNPAASLPRADGVREALKAVEFLVVSDNVLSNDTLGCAPDLVLPALAWGEKDGTVTNSERRISRQRPFLPAPGEARADWAMVAEVGRRLGHGSAFGWHSAADVFAEHAALSAFENDGARDFDIGALSTHDAGAYDRLPPVQWPARAGTAPSTTRFFAAGNYYTPDRKARFIAPAPPRLAAQPNATFPMVLNTGRIRDQWHTMTRTGLSPRLGAHLPAPFLEMHPDDAARLGLTEGDLARVASVHGEAVLEVRVAPGQQGGTVFAPIHWTGETSSHGRIGAVVDGATDPFSGQPESKATPVRVEAWPAAYRGFLLARRPAGPLGIWWARVAVEGGEGLLFADSEGPDAWSGRAAALLGTQSVAEYADAATGRYRAAAFDTEGRLLGALFLGPAADRTRWQAVLPLFAARSVPASERRVILSGHGLVAGADRGPLVCACFGVAEAAIRGAIAQGCSSVERVGERLKAGTNCGSCVPEIRRMLQPAIPA